MIRCRRMRWNARASFRSFTSPAPINAIITAFTLVPLDMSISPLESKSKTVCTPARTAPPQYAEEYSRASAAIAKSGLTGHQNQSWPLWRECALWDDFLDPEERLLEILTNDASRRDAIKQCAHDVYATWQALQPVPSATVKQLGNDRKL